MNDLGESILAVMEDSTLGKMSIYVLNKQSYDIGIDLETISKKELVTLTKRLDDILPFFLGEEAKVVLSKIRKLGNNV